MASAIVASTMLASTFMAGLNVQAASQEVSVANEEYSLGEVQDAIDEVIQIENDQITYSEDDIDQIISEVDITELQKFYDENSLGKITKDDLQDSVISGIKEVNNQIKSGELEVLENGTIIESDDDALYLQGGSTYDKTYWWGRRRYKSTDAANAWVRKLNNAAATNAGAAAIGGAVFGGVGAVPNGIMSAYCWHLANDVSWVNSKTSRGIKADIWWCGYYKIKKQ